MDDLEKKEQVEIETVLTEEELPNVYETIEEISFRISELGVIFDEYDRQLYDEDKKMLSDEEYNALKEEEKELRIRLKELKKAKPKETFWDKVKVWMIVYAIVQFIICIPYGGIYQFTYQLYTQIITWVGSSFANASSSIQGTVQLMALLAFPILNLFLSWILYAYVVKSKFDKKCFAVIWGGQTLLTIISMLIVLV